jgi:hypothetical protein
MCACVLFIKMSRGKISGAIIVSHTSKQNVDRRGCLHMPPTFDIPVNILI